MSKAKFNVERAILRPPMSHEHVGLRPAEALRRALDIINYSAQTHIDRYAMAHLAELAPSLGIIDADAVEAAVDIDRGARRTDHKFHL